jgi:hypothetical protein
MAKEYIEREALLEHIRKSFPYRDPTEFTAGLLDAVEQIKIQPAADVVEVVRCKDCVYRHLTGKAPFMFYTCTIADGLNVCKENAFCSYGERRDNHAAD